MKRIALRIGLLCLFVFQGLSYAGTGRFTSRPGPRPRRAGTILYRLKSTATSDQIAQLQRLLRQHQFQFARRYFGHHKPNAMFRRGAMEADLVNRDEASDQAVHETASPSIGLETEESLSAKLMATGAVDFAEPDYAVPPAVVPSDPGYSSQWWPAAVRLPEAWDITTGDPSIILASCDSGVDASHPDLQPNLLLPGFNSADGSSNTDPIADHGTETIGCAGAIGNNGVGIAGTSWHTHLLPIRITNEKDTNSNCSFMTSGIEWAVNHGARVVSLSWGPIDYCPQTINAAAQYAWDHNAILFISAGNNGHDFSANCPSPKYFVLVGATDSSNAKWSYSNYGACLDLTAPGVDIYTTSVGGLYTTQSGTSFAAPIVAGTAGLLLSLNPNLTPAEILHFMTSTANDLGATGYDNNFGYGLLDAGSALSAAQSARAKLSPSITSLPNAAAIVGVPFNYQITATNHPTGFSASGLPPGLTVDNKGLIAGIPTTAGVYSGVINASNNAGTGSSAMVITIDAGAPAFATTLFIRLQLNTFYTGEVTATNHPTQYQVDGTLPPGLHFAPSGSLSGTPTVVGSYTFNVTAINSAGSATTPMTVEIVGPFPTYIGPLTADGTVGTPFQFQILTTGHPTGYSMNGLPPGLSLNTTTGLVTGTPTSAGIFDVNTNISLSGGALGLGITMTIHNPNAQAPVITITKSAKSSTTAYGNAITFLIDVQNTSAWDATNVVIFDYKPDGCTYVNGSITGPGTYGGGSFQWTLGTLPAHGSTEVSFQVTPY